MGCVESSNEPPQQQARTSVKQPVRNGANQNRQHTKGAPQKGSTARSSRVQNGTAAHKKVTVDIGIQTEGGGFILRRLSSRIKQKRSTREQRAADPPVDDSLLFDLHRTVTLNHSNVSLYIEQALTLPEKQGGVVRRAASSKSRKTEQEVSRYIDQTLSVSDKQGVVRRSSSKSKKVTPAKSISTTKSAREEVKPVEEGPLSKKDIRLVQECWKHVQTDLASFGVELFVRLLDKTPSLAKLFPFGKLNLSPEQLQNNPDLRAHGQRVMETIGTAVEGLEDLELIVAILKDLGERHTMYGAKPEHFSAVAEAFMYSLRNGLPPKVFNSEVQGAYGRVLKIVAETMSSTMGDLDKSEPNEKDLNANEEGPISARDKKLVQGCWKIIQKDLVNIGAVFFVRLLEENPSVRTLFPFGKSPLPPQMLKRNPDLRAHGQNVMETIGAAVSGLDELDVVVTILEELGVRHRMYGAKPAHFKPVVEALMFALTTSLPKDVFTSEVQESWLCVLKVVGSIMANQLE